MNLTSKLTYLALAIYCATYLLLFLMWAGLVACGHADAEQAQYISYIHDALLMLTSHILTILNPAAVSTTASTQSSPTQ